MFSKYEKKLNTRLIGLIMGKPKRKKENDDNPKNTKPQKKTSFFKAGMQQMKKDLKMQ